MPQSVRYAVYGRACLPDGLHPDRVIGVEDGVIALSAPAASIQAENWLHGLPDGVLRRCDPEQILAPAFVDIHCHAGGGYMAYENPAAVMRYHRAHGTAAMLQTLYRDIGVDGMLRGIGRIAQAMREEQGILGVHLEGPYLNPALGSMAGFALSPDPAVYNRLLQHGVVRMCTFAPELEGAEALCRALASRGIVPAIGHSAAGRRFVRRAVEAGARVVTHVFNASGHSEGNVPRGTRPFGFDEACLLEDALWYEFICDSGGLHVRHDGIRLLEKTVGLHRMVAITDCCGEWQGEDVNFRNGELMGSCMCMQHVARNLLHMGYSLPQIFRLTSYQPACAIGVQHLVGSLLPGRQANLLLTDPGLEKIELL